MSQETENPNFKLMHLRLLTNSNDNTTPTITEADIFIIIYRLIVVLYYVNIFLSPEKKNQFRRHQQVGHHQQKNQQVNQRIFSPMSITKLSIVLTSKEHR